MQGVAHMAGSDHSYESSFSDDGLDQYNNIRQVLIKKSVKCNNLSDRLVAFCVLCMEYMTFATMKHDENSTIGRNIFSLLLFQPFCLFANISECIFIIL